MRTSSQRGEAKAGKNKTNSRKIWKANNRKAEYRADHRIVALYFFPAGVRTLPREVRSIKPICSKYGS